MILFGNCAVFKSTEVEFSNAQFRQRKWNHAVELDSFVLGTESCYPALRHFNSPLLLSCTETF